LKLEQKTIERMRKNIMRNLWAVVLISFLGYSFVCVDLVNTKISSHVTMDIRKDLNLVPANGQSALDRQNAPMAMYETVDQEVSLTIKLIQEGVDTTKKMKRQYQNPTANQEIVRDVNLERLFKRSSLIAQFDAVNFLQDTIKDINGEKFIVFEYTADASGIDAQGKQITSSNYCYYQIAYIKNKTYIFNFRCPIEMKDNWQKDTQLMMNSVKIRK
jgi:hypothetical protein